MGFFHENFLLGVAGSLGARVRKWNFITDEATVGVNDLLDATIARASRGRNL